MRLNLNWADFQLIFGNGNFASPKELKRWKFEPRLTVKRRNQSEFDIEELPGRFDTSSDNLYAWVFGQEVVKFGETDGTLFSRIQSHEMTMTRELKAGKNMHRWPRWMDYYERYSGVATVWLRKPEIIRRPWGEYSARKSEEGGLIQRFDPPLNDDKK